MDVAILGCGYVGLALGEALDSAGHEVIGVRRSEEGISTLENAGFRAVRADLADPTDLDAVPDVDAVVFAASSGGGDVETAREVYVDGLSTVIDVFAQRRRSPAKLLYTSSTGVYGDHRGNWVDESAEVRPSTEKARVLVEAETVARSAANRGIEPIVARLGGVYGPHRYRIERYLDGPITEGYLNLIHREDVGGALEMLLTIDAPNTVVVVDDEPVWKPALAAWLAEQCGREPPATVTLAERLAEADLSTGSKRRLRGQKRCSSERLKSLGYEFTFPTYRTGYRAAIDRFSVG